MLKGKRIAIIGGGKMGEVIAGGIVGNMPVSPSNVTVADVVKERLDFLRGKYKVTVTTDNRTAVKGADIIILAVKPQSMGEVLAGVKDLVDKKKLVISIAAGIPISFIEKSPGQKSPDRAGYAQHPGPRRGGRDRPRPRRRRQAAEDLAVGHQHLSIPSE